MKLQATFGRVVIPWALLTVSACGDTIETLAAGDSGTTADGGHDSALSCTPQDPRPPSSSCPIENLSLPTGPFLSIPGAAGPMLAGDFNGDGVPDLVATQYGMATPDVISAWVFLGNGDGTFQSPVTSSAVPLSSGLVAADFNRDGKLDLATGSAVLLGQGDGSFESPRLYGSVGSTAMATGDFNSDGFEDIVVAVTTMGHPDSSGVQVFFGDGDGNLAPGATYDTQPTFPAIAVGDFDGNGSLDLATNTGIWLNDGEGTFSAGQVLKLDIRNLLAGDLNGDGHVDLATEQGVLLGAGDGTFGGMLGYGSAAKNLFESSTIDGPMALGDFNRDGRLDIATDHGVLRGKGDGTFPTATPLDSGFSAASLVSADLDRDGNLDLGFVGRDDPDIDATPVQILLGKGDATWKGPVTYTSADSAQWSSAIAAGDVDGNGIVDLVVSASVNPAGPYGIALLRGSAAGTFRPGISLPTPSAIPIFSLSITDLDGDGNADLLALGTELYVWMGRGDGSFGASRAFVSGLGGLGLGVGTFPNIAHGPGQIAVGDFNGDCIPDVALAAGQVSVLLGRGDGSFGRATGVTEPLEVIGVAIGDFNGDHRVDLATSNGVLLGKGDGSFAAALGIEDAVEGVSAIGDFNNDGALDLAVSTGIDLWIFLGQGNGAFAPHLGLISQEFTTGDWTDGASVLAADIDDDGKLDLIVTAAASGSGASSLTVFLGAGDGTFVPRSYAAGQDPVGAVTADFSRDGKLDVAVVSGVSASSPAMSVLLNQGDCAR
jgi:FG-GAP-like repeat